MDVLDKLNKIRLTPVWVAAAAIANAYGLSSLVQIPAVYAAPNDSALPTTRNTASSLLPVSVASNRVGNRQSTAVENLRRQLKSLSASEKLQVQAPASPAPAAPAPTPPPGNQPPQLETPNQIPVSPEATPAPSPETDSVPAPTDESVPAPAIPSAPIPAPPGPATPQQETPNQIQVPITPGGGSAPVQPSPPSAPTEATPAAPPVPTEQPPEVPTTPEVPPSPAPTPPGTPPAPAPETQPPGAAPAPETEARVLVGEVLVSGEGGAEISPELQNEVYEAIQTQPGQTATRSQLQSDINAVFATGFFANVRAEPEDTPLGVRVSFVVQPNPVLRRVQVQANPGTKVPSVLPPQVVEDAFSPQYGSILNLRRLDVGIKQLTKWYQDNGYVLAQVVDVPQVAPDGTVTLEVAEGVVEDIQVRFVQEGEATNEEGEPISGRTRDFIVTRELALQPGSVFNRNVVQSDLQRVYGLGLFEDVNVSLNPGQDPRQVNVVVNIDERSSGSVAAGLGASSASGFFGTLSYQEQNLGGNNQNLGAELQVGERELLFDARFTDPWIAGDPYRTSYTVNGFRRRSISLIFDGQDEDFELVGTDDRPRVRRLGGGVTFNRPLSRNPLQRSEWTASAGLQYQRISIRDSDGDIVPQAQVGDNEPIDLSVSGDGTDDLLTLQLGAVRDLRNNTLTPTSGSLLRLGVEQSVPVGSGSILLNRLRGSYSQFIPVNFTNFNEGPETLALNIQAGTVLGDLPPYEAFSLGGSNSVRGYDEGDLGSGRSFLQATAEYRFPIFSVVGGALFVDVGTDLGTGNNVPGEPAEQLGKPGSGIGFGVGVRVNSPLGPLRIDYGFNDEGDNRLHFGIGERF